MKFYNNNDLENIRKDMKKHIIIMSIITAIFLAIAVVMIIVCAKVDEPVMGYRNEAHKPYQVISVISGFLMASTLIFLLDAIILDERKLKNHYEQMLDSKPIPYSGEVVGFDKETTVERRIAVTIVKVKINTIDHFFYLLNEFDNPFKVGDMVTVYSANRYIVSYEEGVVE